jgi:hypothetical protein
VFDKDEMVWKRGGKEREVDQSIEKFQTGTEYNTCWMVLTAAELIAPTHGSWRSCGRDKGALQLTWVCMKA